MRIQFISLVGLGFYCRFLEGDYVRNPANILMEQEESSLKPSKSGVIITTAHEHGSSGKQIGKLVAERLDIPFYYGGCDRRHQREICNLTALFILAKGLLKSGKKRAILKMYLNV